MILENKHTNQSWCLSRLLYHLFIVTASPNSGFVAVRVYSLSHVLKAWHMAPCPISIAGWKLSVAFLISFNSTGLTAWPEKLLGLEDAAISSGCIWIIMYAMWVFKLDLINTEEWINKCNLFIEANFKSPRFSYQFVIAEQFICDIAKETTKITSFKHKNRLTCMLDSLATTQKFQPHTKRNDSLKFVMGERKQNEFFSRFHFHEIMAKDIYSNKLT